MENSFDCDALIRGLYCILGEVTDVCQQSTTIFLSGFLVVGFLLIVPAIMQTAAAYIWSNQHLNELIRCQTSNQRESNISSQLVLGIEQKQVLNEKNRTLFLYRILACSASLFVLTFSTLPQLLFVVARSPSLSNIDTIWGWCQVLTYCDHVTRFFATYFIVMPYCMLFWDFFFTEVYKRPNLVTKQIFRAILISSLPIGFTACISPIPIIYIRYEMYYDNTSSVYACVSLDLGTQIFMYFDFLMTRLIPAAIIIFVSIVFLIYLPKRHYGVFFEPGLFSLLIMPHVLVEVVIHVMYQLGSLHLLVNSNFANSMMIFYTLYHTSFSSTFVLATIRSVVNEIKEERIKRAKMLLGEVPSANVRKPPWQRNVIEGLQKQFSIAYRWRSEYAEDEFEIEIDMNEEPLIQDFTMTEAKIGDDGIIHYSVLRSYTESNNS